MNEPATLDGAAVAGNEAPALAAAAPAHRKWLYAAGGAVLTSMLWTVLALWGLGDAPFHTKGEPREGLVVWEMTHDGGWILPKRNGTELPSKPPLFHWLGALTSLARGTVDEWSIRFPSAALSLPGALLVLAAGTAWWSARAGLLAALVLMTMFEWARAATNARVDMTLTFGLEVAVLSLAMFWRGGRGAWLVPLYLGMAWAMLAKGPVGVALPMLTAAALIALSFDRTALRDGLWSRLFDLQTVLRLRLLPGLATVAIVAGTWYVLALFIGGWPFFHKQILAENWFTFFDDADFGGGHRHGLLYLPVQLLLGTLPWTFVLPAVALSLWRARTTLSLRDPRLSLLVWSAVVLLFYEMAASKRGVYLLAMYPALALLIGWWWNEQWQRIDTDRWLARVVEWLSTLLVVVVGLALIVVLLHAAGVPFVRLLEAWLPARAGPDIAVATIVASSRWRPLVLALLLAGLALMTARQAARRAHWSWIFTSSFLSTAVLLVMVRVIVMPALAEQLTLRHFMHAVREVVGDVRNLSFFRTFDYGAVYYAQGHIQQLDDPWPPQAPRFLLVERRFWEANRNTGSARYEAVGLGTPPGDQLKLVLLRRIEAPDDPPPGP